MISVFAQAEDRLVVQEFFELFKTPWEFFQPDTAAEILLCTQTEVPATRARLVLIYAGKPIPSDQAAKIQTDLAGDNLTLRYRDGKIPVYGKAVTFGNNVKSELQTEAGQALAMETLAAAGQTIIRIGYDLFAEIRHLLTNGQPAANSNIPTLENHIALLRDLIVAANMPLVEIPPVPAGYNFTVCLTHDVDHVGIHNHKFDHTLFGFLYRATLGTIMEVCRGRKTWKQLRVNWTAALSLPFVHLELADDFWYQFDRYMEIEQGVRSTFFVVPNKHDSGTDANGKRHGKRATQYDVDDIRDEIKKLRANGNEISLHGIDAWRDSSKGMAEKEKVSRNHAAETGVRMHWLYFNEQSPAILEAAGFAYDSTVGYNQTVGYRAGTTQVYKPLSASKMLELPLHVMDTALFYPSYLNLSPREARQKVGELIAHARRLGGVLTVNWHDRSLAPERLWDDFYIALLHDLKAENAWFPTAAEAVAWFRKRRAATFENHRDGVKINVAGIFADDLPELQLRVFKGPGQKFECLTVRDGIETGLAVNN